MDRLKARRLWALAAAVLILFAAACRLILVNTAPAISPHARSLAAKLPPRWAFALLTSAIKRLPLWQSKLLPPQLAAINIAGAFLHSKALHVAVRLQLAELLQQGPLSVAELAARAGASPDHLARILRALVAVGVFSETSPGVIANNRVSDTLRAGSPNSVRHLVLHFTEESYWGAEKMYESVLAASTVSAFQLQSGGIPYWDWLDQEEHAQQRSNFASAMLDTSSMSNAALLADYNWDRHAGATVADVGGGAGGFLAQLLATYPHLRGVLFDREAVLAQARQLWAERHPQLLQRVEFRTGSFFEGAPPADVYFLRHVLHDWDDASAARILGAVKRAMTTSHNGSSAAAPPPTLLLAETVLPSRQPLGGILGLLDLQMMAMLGGKERTWAEFWALLQGAGFELHSVVPTRSGMSVIVAHTS